MKNKLIINSLIIFALLSLVMPGIFLIQEENKVLANDLELPVGHSLPARVEGTGVYFEIKNSEYLNISVKSTEEIKVVLESIPGMISLNIESVSTATSTNLTLRGLEPNKTYYKYRDGYKNETSFFSSGGSYTFIQDLTQPHRVWIQEKRGPAFPSEKQNEYKNIFNALDANVSDSNLAVSQNLAVNSFSGNPTELFTIPDEIKVSFMVGKEIWQPETEFQIGEGVSLMIEAELLRGGSYPAIAQDTTFVISNEQDNIIWTTSVGPVGEGWTCCPGGGWGVGVFWGQVDMAGNPVTPGIYKAGVIFKEPNYPIPSDFSGAISFSIVPPGPFSGKVTALNNVPISGALVEAAAEGKITSTTTTDNFGNYFIELPFGTYDLRVSAVGYADLLQTGVSTLANKTKIINFMLTGGSSTPWSALSPVPGWITEGGGALVNPAGSNYIYALEGIPWGFDRFSNLWRYDILNSSWRTMDPAPASMWWGGAAVSPNPNYIYVLRGHNSNDFWAYSISDDSWTILNSTPFSVYAGGSLLYLGSGDYIYAIRGYWSTDFWRYSISQNKWESLAPAPKGTMAGCSGSLSYPGSGDYIYAIRGGNSTDFWRYSVSNNEWESMPSLPAKVYIGGSSISPTKNYIYAFRGDNTPEFWRFSISENSWTAMPSTLSNVYSGCSLSYVNSNNFIYALRGGGTGDFRRYFETGQESPINQPPTLSNPNQYKSDGTTKIDEEGITAESTVVFRTALGDLDNDKVKLQVELKEFNQQFNEQDLLESDFISSGTEAVITRYGLIDGQYKWRARAIDDNGGTSDWQEFGEAGNVDFEIKLVPLYTQIISPYPSEDETKLWADLEYASGFTETYKCGSKIWQCGCAITSIVMIARYYDVIKAQGKDVNPGTINEWLKTEPGGYENGSVNWIAGAKYTDWRIKYEKTDETTNNYALLDQYLNKNQPVVVKEINPRHYIVIDNKLATTYGVKDSSWYNTKNLDETTTSWAEKIRDYNNSLYGLRIYKKGEGIAQSAITFALGSPAELLIVDPLGRKLGKDQNGVEYQEIPGAWYFEDGFDDPSGENLPSQEGNKLIQILEPIDGDYQLQVIGTGEGSYTLESNSYDTQGNVNHQEFHSETAPGYITQYNLSFDSSNSASTTIELFDEIPPEAEIFFNPNNQQLEVKGTDNTTVHPIVSVIENKKERIYQIKDEAGNITKLYFDKLKQEGKQIKAELETIQYNKEPIIKSETELKYEWSLNKDGTVKELEQRIKVEEQFDIKAKYNHQKNKTEIEIKTSESKEKQTLSGLVIIKLITKSGVFGFSY